MPLSTRARSALIGLAGLITGGLITGAIALVLWPERSTPLVGGSSGLAPDRAVIRHRFAAPKATDPRRELDEAITALSARVKTASPSPLDLSELSALHFQRGQLSGDRRDYDQAEALARQSLAILPTPNSASLTLARLANTRHEFREALKIAHDVKRTSVAVPTIQATAHLALGDLPAAAEAANAGVAMKPDPGTYLTRALVMQAQGRDREAASDFAAAVRVEDHGDPQGAARLRSMWGRFLLRRGELDAAGMLFDEALRIAPDFTLAQALRGEQLLRSGKPKEAAAQLEQAFAASRQVRYLIDQARALEAAGDLKNADAVRAQVETLVRAELGEGGLGHRLDLVEVLVDRGTPPKLNEAIALGREEVRRRPSADTRYQLARAYARSGDVGQALVEIQGALATGAREPQFYELASRLEKARNNVARATMYAKLAAELDPGAHGWRGLGMP